MCTAYRLGKKEVGRLPKGMGAAAGRELGRMGERLVRPTISAPVVGMDGELEEMRWGFSRPFSHAVVNAREDKLGGQMWREAMEGRRCLIPATGYYEWSGPKGEKRTHLFRSAEGRGEWLWIAGIWEEDEKLGRCFSMITTQPRGVVCGVHDRMPAVLSPDETQTFLRGEMKAFLPSETALRVEDAVNPLTGRKPGPVQDELF
ncbi:MAG: SOS response-associated peptidase family protein [Luteolibacter sp.]